MAELGIDKIENTDEECRELVYNIKAIDRGTEGYHSWMAALQIKPGNWACVYSNSYSFLNHKRESPVLGSTEWKLSAANFFGGNDIVSQSSYKYGDTNFSKD
jgi:hypothetical protein